MTEDERFFDEHHAQIEQLRGWCNGFIATQDVGSALKARHLLMTFAALIDRFVAAKTMTTPTPDDLLKSWTR